MFEKISMIYVQKIQHYKQSIFYKKQNQFSFNRYFFLYRYETLNTQRNRDKQRISDLEKNINDEKQLKQKLETQIKTEKTLTKKLQDDLTKLSLTPPRFKCYIISF